MQALSAVIVQACMRRVRFRGSPHGRAAAVHAAWAIHAASPCAWPQHPEHPASLIRPGHACRLPKAGVLSLECTLAAEAGAGAAELRALAALVAGLAAAPPAPGALPDELHARSRSGARAADAPAAGPSATCRALPLDAEAARDGAAGGARRRALVALLSLAPGLESEYAMQDGQVAAAALLQGLTPALAAPWQRTLQRILTQ